MSFLREIKLRGFGHLRARFPDRQDATAERERSRTKHRLWCALSAGAFLAALLSESLTPAGFTHGSLYMLSILAASLSRDRSAVWVATFAGVCGTAAGLLLWRETNDLVWILADRLALIFVLIAVGALTHFLLRERQLVCRQSVALRETDEALLENQRRLENAERIGESGSWEPDPSTGAIACSRNFHEIFGLSHLEPGHSIRTLLSHVDPDDRRRLVTAVRSALQQREPVDMIHRIIRPDGEIRRVRTLADVLQSRDRTILSGVTRDLTERLSAEERAKEGETNLRFAREIARVGGWYYDQVTDQLVWSEKAATIRGAATDDRPSIEEVTNTVAAAQRSEFRRVVETCLEQGESFDLVVDVEKPQPLWMRLIGEPVRDDAGDIVGARGAMQDVTELISAREQSRLYATRLERTLDQMSEGFFVLDEEWRYTFLNRHACEIAQRPAQELLGQVVWDVFPESRGSLFEENFREAVASGEPVEFVAWYPPMSKWFRIDAEPTPDGLAVFLQDVTRQKADEEQLRLLSAATARLNDMVLITEGEIEDPVRGPRIVYANEAFERQTGYRPDEFLGQTPAVFYGEGTEVDELERIGKSMAAGLPVHAELTSYRKNGDAFALELDIVPMTDGGTITHWVAVGRDVSDRARFLEDLRLSEERFRLVAQATNDVVYDWSIESDAIWWSDNAADLLGKVPAAPDGEKILLLDRLHPDDRERVWTSKRAMTSGDTTVFSEEYRLRHDDRYLTVVENAFVLRAQDGKVRRIVGSLQDVTDVRAQEAQMREAQKLEVTGQLTGGIAHDFNNLLSIIIGNTELVEDLAADNPELRQLAETTIAAAERGAVLTRHLLAFARRQPLAPETVEVNVLIEEMQPLILRALTERITLNVTTEPDAWPVIVDRHQLENALLNLAINARDAMPGGGHLTIETARRTLDEEYTSKRSDVSPGDYVMIALSDNGEGMCREVLEKVFEPFFTTKEIGKGSGMGLSMVYGFIKQSRGHIVIYSEPGEGTTVRLFLPRSGGSTPAAREQTVELTEVAKTGEHILVVEDDDRLRTNVAAQLEALGYRLTLASNGGEGLEVLKKAPDVALLFTDIVMPGGMNGRELAERARELRPDLKIVYTSGYSLDASINVGRVEAGARFLSKPYRRSDLAQMIRDTLSDENGA